MNIRELDGKLIMPKTGRMLSLTPYQEEIIENLMNTSQNIYYRTRMGNSTALIYYFIMMLKNKENYKICYVSSDIATSDKTRFDFEKYLQYNLKYINDNYYSEKDSVKFETGSSVTFVTAGQLEDALMGRASMKSKFDKVICENYVFSRSVEADITRFFNQDIQYLLENS